MPAHVPALFAAAAFALLLGSASAATLGWQRKARRGALCWAAAHTMLIGSLLLQAVGWRHELTAPLAAVLALQWPLLMLAGVRRFYSRGGASVPAWLDGVVLAVGALAIVGTALAPFDAVSPGHVYAVAMLVATVYAAAAVRRLEEFATTPTLKALLAGLVLSATVQVAWAGAAFGAVSLAAGFGPVPPAAFGAAATLATAAVALLGTQLWLVMHHERQVTQLRASQRKLRHLVDVDALTQLPNRRHFHEVAERAIKAAPELATIVVFDVDRLQRINELLGHANGDEALRQIGTALRETLRRRDVAGRLGGDEFGVVLPRTRAADVDVVIARINARIDDRQVAPRIARISLNAGVTQMQAGESFADALRRAEIGLTVSRDEARRLADQRVVIAAEAAELRSAPAAAPSFARPSQAAPLHSIPIGEVVGAG